MARFNPPPGWPTPRDFHPGRSFAPPPSWDPVPDGWPLWLDEDGHPVRPPADAWHPGRPADATAAASRGPLSTADRRRLAAAVVIALVLAAVVALVATLVMPRALGGPTLTEPAFARLLEGESLLGQPLSSVRAASSPPPAGPGTSCHDLSPVLARATSLVVAAGRAQRLVLAARYSDAGQAVAALDQLVRLGKSCGATSVASVRGWWQPAWTQLSGGATAATGQEVVGAAWGNVLVLTAAADSVDGRAFALEVRHLVDTAARK